MKVIKCLYGRPSMLGEVNGYNDMCDFVGGYIEGYYPFDDDVAIVCNEEGKIIGLPMNRFIHDKNGRVKEIICGDFFICGVGEEDFTDIPEELIDKYMQLMDDEIVGLYGVIANYKR